jgi:hypothetical protein
VQPLVFFRIPTLLSIPEEEINISTVERDMLPDLASQLRR